MSTTPSTATVLVTVTGWGRGDYTRATLPMAGLWAAANGCTVAPVKGQAAVAITGPVAATTLALATLPTAFTLAYTHYRNGHLPGSQVQLRRAQVYKQGGAKALTQFDGPAYLAAAQHGIAATAPAAPAAPAAKPRAPRKAKAAPAAAAAAA